MEQKELEPNFGRGGDLKSYFLSLTDGEHYTIEPKLTESLSESGMSGKQEFSPKGTSTLICGPNLTFKRRPQVCELSRRYFGNRCNKITGNKVTEVIR